MMKKKIYYCLITLFCSIYCTAHTYMPMLQERMQWNILHVHHTTMPDVGYEKTEILTLGGDTVVAEKTYVKLYSCYNENRSDSTLIGLLREDTKLQQVYYQAVGKTEKLLYDFNVQVDDTLYTYLGNPCMLDSIPNIVTSIDTEDINGTLHKKITLKIIIPYEGERTQVWIEGIGSDQGLIYRSYETLPGGEIYYLLCMYRNNNLVYQPAWESFSDCFIWNIRNAVPQIKMNDFLINIEQVRRELSIVTTEREIFNVVLFDIWGRKVLDTSAATSEITISTQHFAVGTYILEIVTASGEKWRRKIIL